MSRMKTHIILNSIEKYLLRMIFLPTHPIPTLFIIAPHKLNLMKEKLVRYLKEKNKKTSSFIFTGGQILQVSVVVTPKPG